MLTLDEAAANLDILLRHLTSVEVGIVVLPKSDAEEIRAAARDVALASRRASKIDINRAFPQANKEAGQCGSSSRS